MFSLNEHVAPKLLLFLKKERTCSYLLISYSPIGKISMIKSSKQQIQSHDFITQINTRIFLLLNYSDFKSKHLPVKRCSEYGTRKIIDVNNLALNRVYFPNYCLIIKTSISLKEMSNGFCQFAAVKKKKVLLQNTSRRLLLKSCYTQTW